MSAGDWTLAAVAFFVSYSRLAAARSITIESRSTTPTVGRPSMENVPSLYASPACAAACSLVTNDAPAIRSPADNQPSSLTCIIASL